MSDHKKEKKMMINLFSFEILIGLAVGILIGWVLKKSLMKNEKPIDEVDLANTVKNLEQTIKDYQKENSEEKRINQKNY